MKIRVKQLLLIMLILVSTSSFSQDRLSKSKDEVKKDKSSSEASSSAAGTSEDNTYVIDNSGSGNNGFFVVFGKIIYYATYYVAIGSYNNESQLHNGLSKYPYYIPKLGNYVEEVNETIPTSKSRIDISDHFLTANAIYGNHLKAKFRPWQYFYLQVDYINLVEPKNIDGGKSSLSMFNFNLCYDRMRFERFNLGWTLGVTYLASGIGKAGFNYGLNLEYFFPLNISLYSSIKGSFVNGSPVDQFEAKLRYHKSRFFISAGYEVIRVASEDFQFAAFGLGVYF